MKNTLKEKIKQLIVNENDNHTSQYRIRNEQIVKNLLSLIDEEKDSFRRKVEEACKTYDEKYGRYPESEFEGDSVLRFINDKLKTLL